MSGLPSRKIDIFSHILTPKYKEALYKKAKPCYNLEANLARPALSDLDERFRVMDKFEGLRQVLTVGAPPVEYVVSPDEAVELSKIANDEMAKLVETYPNRFVAAVAQILSDPNSRNYENLGNGPSRCDTAHASVRPHRK